MINPMSSPRRRGSTSFFVLLKKLSVIIKTFKVSSWMPAFAGMTVLFFVLPVIAEDANPVIRVDKAACRYVMRHVPDADVEYKPGVDVHGKKVVPADIDPPIDYHLEDSFYLRLTTDAVKAFGIKVPEIRSNVQGSNPNSKDVTSETAFGYVTLKNGKAYLNNRPLDPDAQRQLAVLCKSQGQQ